MLFKLLITTSLQLGIDILNVFKWKRWGALFIFLCCARLTQGAFDTTTRFNHNIKAETSSDTFDCTDENLQKLVYNLRANNSHIRETADTSNSSWIRRAEYFGISEFLVLNMINKDYIFARVPRSLWENFKLAESKGKFYHSFIKGRYDICQAITPTKTPRHILVPESMHEDEEDLSRDYVDPEDYGVGSSEHWQAGR